MAKLINLSEAASLAIHSMVLIAKSKTHINVNKLAEEMGASRNHLAKIMQQLVKFGFLKSVRGPNGGFVLNMAPENITMLSIYEAIEGKIEVHDCPLDRQICPFDKCLMSGLVKDVSIQFKDYFSKNTIADYISH